MLRDWQKEYKDVVIDALRNGRMVLLQAPTGSGKTLFALLTALEVLELESLVFKAWLFNTIKVI